jgi:hypothetical protein
MTVLSPSALWFATSMPADTIITSLIGLCSVLHADEIELGKIGRTQPLFLVWAIPRPGNPLPITWILRYRSSGSKITACESGLTILAAVVKVWIPERNTGT